jgi:hypothetical protein
VQLEHPREMIRQFTPNWFAATMGTGILALALPQMPGIGPAVKPIGEALWLFNIGLFMLFSGLYGARWLLFGHEAGASLATTPCPCSSARSRWGWRRSSTAASPSASPASDPGS